MRGDYIGSTKYKVGTIKNNNQGTPMKIVAYHKYNDMEVQFLDEHGYVKEHVLCGAFDRGEVKNPYDRTVFGVGYLGVGEYSTGQVKNQPLEYITWSNMLGRCYSKRMSENQRSYYGITTVCEEWQNYQVFAKWFWDNYYEVDERLHLDKDILNPKNTVYSPKNCILVPQRINELFHYKPKKNGLPSGITLTNACRYSVTCCGSSLGTYATLEEAYGTYAIEKERIIKQVADEYKNIIPQKVYDALYQYKVKIENDKNYNAA